MALVIDSSIFIDIERRGLRPDGAATLAPGEIVALASITASELLAGVHRANTVERRRRREEFVEEILARFPVLPFDLRVARVHARIWAELAATGQIIGPHDLIIAATALTHGYDILTLNLREFRRVPGLVVRQP